MTGFTKWPTCLQALLLTVSIAMPIAAEARTRDADDPFARLAARGGIGFTEGPDAFLANFELEGMLNGRVGVGLAAQLGVEDDFILFSPHLFTRYRFSLRQLEDEYLRRIRPFVQGGVGITHIDVDRGGRDRDATDVLINFGGGLDYPVTHEVEIGTRMLINVIPGEVLNQRIYFSWELISVRYRW